MNQRINMWLVSELRNFGIGCAEVYSWWRY